ncbi:MAG: DNA-directed RNA polymerase subunit beta', partial [Candidatus Babeliales bacterium]
MNKLLERFKEYISASQFNAIRLGLASPEKIRTLSYGEVKKIETINYRTLKPEKDGLFCARIFGPVKDWECNCGKYKRMKHRGVTCEKCGVEVIQARVRRERMAHIDLVSPVCHIWYLKGIPSYLSLIVNMTVKDLERVIYFDAYLVLRQGNSPFPQKTLLSSVEYQQYYEGHADDLEFRAEIGAEAIRILLSMMDLQIEISHLQDAYAKSSSIAVRHKIMRRMKVLTDLSQANLKPEWIVLTVLPVLPPDLRPLVPLEGGRFASSDLNELYRRVLNRNIRLRRLIEIEAPEVIIKNEKRMLQESVDGLIDNGRRGQPVRGSNKRPLKSLSEMLRGKQGRFRQNLLGKRVDYSGRSVIVVDPELRMDQCGLPKIMALELFKSNVFAELLRRELAPNLRAAKKMVEQATPEVWDALEEVVRAHTVLLNRAPTLHRLGIQSFYPILVDGKAIKIHPLVCAAFNADFDGDQMAVHVPLSKKSQIESKELILSTKNLLSPANGRPITVPSQDMVLGLYYITKVRLNVLGEGTIFSSTQEVVAAYQNSKVDLHAKIKVRIAHEMADTTVGRVLLFDALPAKSPFNWVNRLMTRSDLVKLVENVYYMFGQEATAPFLDRIKRLGFRYSTSGGISISLSDLVVPAHKGKILDKAKKSVAKVEQMYMDGAITNGERYNKIISIWGSATAEIASEMAQELEHQDEVSFLNSDKKSKPFNPIFMMLQSGARGSRDQIKQLVGMRGLMAKPTGEIMETPVTSSFKDGLSVFEYFISTHGARKGQADTALKTANSGYLTRRLVDVAQDVVIVQQDCRTLGYIELVDLKEAGEVILALSKRVYGRVLAADLYDPITGKLLFSQGYMIGKNDVETVEQSTVQKVKVRSTMTCQTKRGVCVQCYGMDLSKSALADIGTTVGIIAAQSIGEPGTQLTMRTFHIGGTASGLREQSSFVSKHDGMVEYRGVHAVKNSQGNFILSSRKASIVILADDGRELQEHTVEYGSVIFVQNGQKIKAGQMLVEWDPNSKVIFTEKAGIAHYIDLVENVTLQEKYDESTRITSKMVLEPQGEKYQPAISILDDAGEEIAHYYLPAGSYLNIENGQKVVIGEILVKMPRELSKTKDITTGGLPRIAEFFEARTPKDAAIISDINGEVVFGGIQRGMLKISVVSAYETYDYLVPRGAQLNVANGDHVSAGDLLTTGSPVLHDILRIKGQDVLQRYL